MKNSSFDWVNATFFEPEGLFLRGAASQDGRRGKPSGILPENGRIEELLGLDDVSPVEAVLRAALLEPLAELTSTRGKRFRGQLVTLGYRLVSDSQPSALAMRQCCSCADVVELIHAGSLVIDDIEDASGVRRGRPALHVRYGIPIALNAGNWLYFWPFELLREAELPSDKLFFLYEYCHRTLLRAHFGQAVDLGTRIDTLSQTQIAATCLASMKLKTGALMGFAITLGGAIADASQQLLSILGEFGRELGVALQMFDDLGNVMSKCEPSKRYEDLRLHRPSWVWACAAENSTPEHFERLCAAVGRLPDANDLELWIEDHDLVQRVRESAHRHLDATLEHLEWHLNNQNTFWSKLALDELRHLAEEITIAYG